MKLQHFIILFLVIMLPMALILSQYTGLQIDILTKTTQYDTALLGAAYDTISAFDLNTVNSDASSVIGEEIRDLEAIISTFTRSLSTSLNITGVSDDYILTYVPTMVFGLYDGYYIYSRNSDTGELELKPYIYYTKTYKSTTAELTISYSLDNYVSIYGTYKDGGTTKYISASGYLINTNDVKVSTTFAYVSTTDSDGNTVTSVVDPGVEGDGSLSWITYKGYSIEPEIIYENETLSTTDAVIINQPEESTEAMLYYYEAYQFTKLYEDAVKCLNDSDKAILLPSSTNDPEDETSAFVNEKYNVIQESITQSLQTALYTYEGSVAQNYEMPQLTGEDWEKIFGNISIIAFLKDIPIGTTTYNNYVVVNSTTNQKYTSSASIEFIKYTSGTSYGTYHKITCEDFLSGLDTDPDTNDVIIGYASVDFERYRYTPDDSEEYYYYYKHNEYEDYECEVESIESTTVADIDSYISSLSSVNSTQKDIALEAYYTAVGRIRYKLIKASSYINMSDTSRNFTVIYNTNGGTWPDGTINNKRVTSTNGKVVIYNSANSPTKTGWTFMGWSTAQTTSEAEIKPGDTLYFDGSTITLYAVYAQQVAITYYSDSTTVFKVETKTTDVDYSITTSTPYKDQYSFIGWSTDPNATTYEWKAGDIYTGNDALVLYAVYSEETIIITYKSSGMPSVEVEVNKYGGKTISGNTYAYDNYTFKGWDTSSKAKDIIYNVGDTYVGTSDITLYAVLEEKTYTITYNANGGEFDEGEVKQETKYASIPTTITTEEPIRSSYTFLGWSTSNSATVAQDEYAPGSTYSTNADITLYAVWEGERYTISYDANGGANAPSAQTTTKDRSITITSSVPTRDGYVFEGWATYENLSKVKYYSGDEYGTDYSDRTSITLYAVWTVGAYTVTYDTNGGSWSGTAPSAISVNYGSSVKLTTQIPSKTGYYFAGWSKDVTTEAKDVEYKSNSTYTHDVTYDVTLYAIYGAYTYTITFYGNNSDTCPDMIQVAYGTAVTLTEEPTRTGYTFAGWALPSDTSTVVYNTGSTITVTEDIELYAVWTADSNTVVVDPNGGNWSGSTASQTITGDTNTTTSINNPTKTGYTFDGWTITGNSTVPSVGSTKSYIVIGAGYSTLTAKWKINQYTLSYDKNAGSDDVSNMPTSTAKDYNSTFNLSTLTPARSGYTFLGWSTTANGSATYKQGASYTMPAHDVTLWAVWKITDQTPPTITIALSQGNSSSDSLSALSVKATITFSDAYGVATRMYKLNKSSSSLGTSTSSYSGTLSSNSSTITLTFSSTGTYYLHVLGIDTNGNAAEKISVKITVSQHEHSEEGGSCYEYQVWDYCINCGERSKCTLCRFSVYRLYKLCSVGRMGIYVF